MFKSIFRHLKKSKLFSAINIFGLAISLTAAILIIFWVQDEQSFDKFHSNYENIFKVNAHMDPENNGNVWSSTPGPIVNYAKDLSDVQSATRFSQDWNETLINEENNHKIRGLKIGYADSSFFDIFSFPLLEGSLVGFHTNNTYALISKSTAEKLFGSQQVIGKVFRYDEETFSVAGVMEDVPHNSSLKFDVIMPFGILTQLFKGNGSWKTIDEDLGNYRYATYVLAKPKASPDAISKSITEIYNKARNGENNTVFILDPLKTMHLITPDGNKSGLRMVQMFSLIAILLLIIGAVNYINLSTARALDRAKEIGIRKVIGASRIKLFQQFVLETMVVFFLALALAFGLIFLLQSGYNQLAQKSISFSVFNQTVWLYIGSAIIGTLLLSSIYPALQLSAFQPLQSLKGKSKKQVSSNSTRKILVIFQFTISVTLIVCTLVIKDQLSFIQRIDLGYDKEQVFTLGLPKDAYKHMDAIRTELNNNSAIDGVSLTGIWNLADYFHSTSDIDWAGKAKDNRLVVSQATIDKDFLPLMNIPFIEGSNFTGMPSDSSSYVINETLAKQMGLTPPYVGTTLTFHEVPGQIIGVVNDFHFKSIKEKIGPMVFWTHWGASTLYIKTSGDKAQQAIQAVENIYNRYPSDSPFSYTFLDQQFENLYKAEQRTGLLFNIFSGIAIFISALGLFALATHDAQTRIKEIGIRKVLGASVFGIVRLLGKNFVLLVCIAIVIACPIALYLMNQWLNDFAYKTDMNIATFFTGSIIAILIAIVTISFQAIRAAMVNPVDSLRDE